ncbi:D-alanyl-D-alanine carboxypeptidase family protein [Tyzzerella sp. An114]|uniref:D-alanyl-D-alanine carboxypeptidase family protein n=1 Tax=Tyzzerella sp. An114 TaxID=1965545 RepID=UPI001302B55A|nr:D-alanyl-D-alanine carboxypeptidase family protein [Tyzzerella sp. An114]
MKNWFKKLIVVTFTITTAISTVAFAKPSDPVVNAQAAILIEPETGTIIYEKNSNERMYPASMTKILTALVTLDYFDYDALVTVGNEINEVTLDSSKAGHKKGETLSVENLIRGLMIPSGNDSANVLAAAVAKKVENNNDLSYEECEKIFTDLMNKKAEELGCKNSHFANAHGYHDDNHYTTAYDMSLITAEALKNDTIKKIAGEKSFSGDGAGNTLEENTNLITQEYNWKSHNLLIADSEYHYEYATGLKTGFTDQAGDCVAATAEKDGTELIAVIMNSEDPNRWIDAKNLFDYGFNNFSINTFQKKGDVVETVSLINNNRLNGDTLDVIVKEDVSQYMLNSDIANIEKEIKYNDEFIAKNKDGSEIVQLKAPIEKDSEVGTVSYKLNGETIKESKLYASTEVQKSTIISSIKYFFKNLFSNIFTLKGLIIFIVIIIVIIIIILIIRNLGNKKRRTSYKYRMPRNRRF